MKRANEETGIPSVFGQIMCIKTETYTMCPKKGTCTPIELGVFIPSMAIELDPKTPVTGWETECVS